MKKIFCVLTMTMVLGQLSAKEPVEYVDPFIGSANFAVTNPGAVTPNGMMSVAPFNVMGSKLNYFDKDVRWWSTPYDIRNRFFTGFSHVNLSGVGCPELGSLLLMPTTGELVVDYREYGSEYKDEAAYPGYYTNFLTKYNVKSEVGATPRTGIARFTFPAGQSNILLNLGYGLTNESGAYVRKVSDTEFEGMKVLGTFCYNPQAVFPIYFVMRVNKKPADQGFWKFQRPKGLVAAEWDVDDSKYKIYSKYGKDIAGDDIGAWFTFNTSENEVIEVQMGVSFVSIENARLNLDSEQPTFDFDKVVARANKSWNDHLSRIKVEGGTEEQKTILYTGLYHALIHPNILQDVNGQYPAMESEQIMTTDGNRYTVFSLWDTYRNFHQLMALVYPEKQEDMIRSMVDMYKESGWFPRWELYGRETLTMTGDPAITVITDAWMKGFRAFDAEMVYEGFYKSATAPGRENYLRCENDEYMALGYIPMRPEYSHPVSTALEYYMADYAMSRFAAALGKKKDAEMFYNRAMGYKNYYSKESGTFRPKMPNGEFVTPFDPKQGMNFEANPGFHEGSAWNYTFFVPYDVQGLAKLMGGRKPFIDKLQMVFDTGLYDPANEPDIAYAHLFSYFKGEEWRTQKEISRLLSKYYNTTPAGIPGNDDTGTMSTWAIFNMIGFYPDNPGEPAYTLVSPVFDKVTIQLDPRYYPQSELVIESNHNGDPENIYIKSIKLGDKRYNSYRISHDDLVKAGKLSFELYKR